MSFSTGTEQIQSLALRMLILLVAISTWAGFAIAQTAGSVDHRNSIAILVGNAKYEHTTPVPYAHNDARAIQDYLVRRLGFRADNIVMRLDLGRERMETLFGEPDRPDGELMDRLLDRRLENRGDVFVFYSGHGVPDPDPVRDDDRKAFLLPVDVRQDRIAAAAFSIERLQKKLDLIRAHLPEGRNVVLMIDACFSGRTPSAKVAESDVSLFRFSRGSFSVRLGQPQAGLVRLVAATGDQVAYWDERAKLGLFTSLFLRAVGGDADGPDFGNSDRQVDGSELTRFLEERLPAEARRRHQRSQRPSLDGLERFRWTLAPVLPTTPPVVPAPQVPRAVSAPVAPTEQAAPAAKPADRVRAPAKAAGETRPVRRPAVADDDEEEVSRPRQPPAARRVPAQEAAPQAGCRVVNGVRFCG